MSAFEKITGITLYDEEKVLDLCEGDKVVASYEVTDSKDAFEEGFTSQWKLKWFKEAEVLDGLEVFKKEIAKKEEVEG